MQTSPHSHKKVRRFCQTLDLKNDIVLINKYKHYHSKEGFWPEIGMFLKACGIENMEIYIYRTRLFTLMEVNESYTEERLEELKKQHPKDAEWQSLMLSFQRLLPESTGDQRWIEMEKIFDLNEMME